MHARLLFVALVVLPVGGLAIPIGGADDARTEDQGSLPGIVFVGAPIFDEKTDGGAGVYQGSYHWRDGYVYARSATFHRAERTMGPVRPGKNLYALVPARPDGKLTRLTHLTTGAVFKPEPHFDGKKVLFSMRRDDEDWFHLYEVNVEGTQLRQLTDGPFNDFAGTYLPDGRIVFCSDRTGYLEEYHEERTECLFVMSGDGTGIEQITFLPGTYFEPTVLRDGRILFSFWDAFHIDVPPFDKHETYLMTVNPDGTEERHLFGSGQYRFFNRERHSGIGLTQAREMPDGRILVQSEMGPTLIDLRAGFSVPEAMAAIFPGTTSIQLGGTTHRSHLSPRGTRSTAYPLQDGRFLFSATAPGARDSAIYVCDPDTREEKLVVNLPNFAEFDAVPVLVDRPRPRMLPAKTPRRGASTASPAGDSVAKFLVVAGHASDQPERMKAMKKARFFRVIEAEYTGVTTSSHTNLETRILGVVPMFPDGSAYFEAPADTPLFLDPLDAGGNRILIDWPYENTAVAKGLPYPATQMAYMSARPHEMRSCYGCHPPQADAVPNVKVEAMRFPPVKVARESTDMQYRRNEPDAYRRQARFGEAGKYREWLKSKDPLLRARACEMLMYIEDGTEQDVPQIAALLKDGSVEVRRAASLALTRLATLKEGDAILIHLFTRDKKEADPIATLYLRNALEALIPTVFGNDFVELAIAYGKEDLRFSTKEDGENFEALGRWRAEELGFKAREIVRKELTKLVPNVLAIRAAGKQGDADAVKLLIPWLKKHEYEYLAAEAAIALGRIGTKEAIAALLAALREEVPNKKVHISRYLQHGPRPEEYALLKALLLAKAPLDLSDLHLILALLPNTFTEKPRFEDRMRAESQRVLMPRLLLERAGYRRRAVELLVAALKKERRDEPLYREMLKAINLERPFSEHGRPFPVVQSIGGEEALWLLGCLVILEDFDTNAKRQALEDMVVPFLTSANHRERIDAAVLLGITGFSERAAKVLAAAIAKPYDFQEIASIGQGMPGGNYRDKAYLAMALARQAPDVGLLKFTAAPRKMTRDIRYGLVRGLTLRGKADAVPLLIDMATRDPLTLIRQQARYGLADIQDVYRLAGKVAPDVKLPEPEPLEALYPPRGLKWANTDFRDLPKLFPAATLTESLAPANFRNLNMAQASGAGNVMVARVEETRLRFTTLAEEQLWQSLASPYPYIHYLATQGLARRQDAGLSDLAKRLDACVKSQDTVGFWWRCEALGQAKRRDAEVVKILRNHAVPRNPPGTFGPEGMAIGYQAARTLAKITADVGDADVGRLLKEKNVWLRAGALAGLAEAQAQGIEALLRQAAEDDEAAQVRHEAQVQLRRLRKID